MHFSFETTEAVKSIWEIWAPVAVQTLVTLGAIFGGAGFWQYKQAQLQAKRDAESKETGLESKVNTMTDDMKELKSQFGDMAKDIQDLKKDVALLEKANTATVKYRELRDKQDKEAAVVQKAIIKSLTGILRERLLENYKRCIEKGFYTKEEREVYGAMYKCYTEDPFNGNGVMHQLQPVMQALPWTEDTATPKPPINKKP